MPTFKTSLILLSLTALCAAPVHAAPKKKKTPTQKQETKAAPTPGAAPAGKAEPVAKEPLREPTPKTIENLGEKVLVVVRGATRIQVWRVGGSGGLRPEESTSIGSEFVRQAPGKEMPEVDIRKFRSILYDDASFRFEQESNCNFEPNVSFQVQAGLDTLEALVSFKCNQMMFIQGKPGGRWLPGGLFDIKPARAQLLQLAKEALPQDAATQKLR